MKCHHCDHPATFHITELTEEGHQELHLCQEHAADYLMQSEGEESGEAVPSFGGALAQHFQISQTGEELARLDETACPICGISFYEFRQVGRLGCPHDYIVFGDELESLLISIHGESRHVGKHPLRNEGSTDDCSELIRMRRQLSESVDREAYEEALQLRDQIQSMEEGNPIHKERDEKEESP